MENLFVAGKGRGLLGGCRIASFLCCQVPISGTGEALVARKGYTALSAGQKW